jgi:5-methyltetrahydrofolate--homocysteine methyltransferase
MRTGTRGWIVSFEALSTSIFDGDTDAACEVSAQLLTGGASAEEVLAALSKGMSRVGDKWDDGEIFLAEVLMAVDAFQAVMEEVSPHMRVDGEKGLGTVVIGTVKEDIHYIGKNIVATLLRAAGFKVVDLGEDVSPDAFCDAVVTERPEILAMSCLISTSLPAIRTVVDALKGRGLRTGVQVMIGGAPVTRDFVRAVGGDLYAADAFEAVRAAREAVAQ